MNRIQGVDTFRIFAVIMVIAIHTEPFHHMPASDNLSIYYYVAFGINSFARFAVPFFFVIAGYFWSVKIQNGSNPIEISIPMIKRLVSVFLFWSFIYLIPYGKQEFHVGFKKMVTEWDFSYSIPNILKFTWDYILSLFNSPVKLAMQGTRTHLWFLVALVFSVSISAIFIHKKAEKSLLCFSILLYIIGVLAKSYANTPIGISLFGFNTLNGPFFGTLFFVSGYFISRIKPNHKWLFYGLLIFVVGYFLHITEIYFLYRFYNTEIWQEYVFGTFFMGIGSALMSLSDHPILQSKFLGAPGRLTLGIYAVHLIFADILNQVAHSLAWEIMYIVVVFALSLLSAYILSKFKFTRNFVV